MSRRREFKKTEKRKMLARSGGVCERALWRPGEVCTRPAKDFDHLKADGLGGEPVAENGAHLCVPCHKEKTHGEDRPRMQKADNQRDVFHGLMRKSRPIQSAGFRKAPPQRKATKPLAKPPLPRRPLFEPINGPAYRVQE